VLFRSALVRFKSAARALPNGGVFWLLWILPNLLFLLLIHMTEPGHVMLLIPAGYVLLALDAHSHFRAKTARMLVAGVAAASLLQFIAYPWSADSTGFKRTLDAKIAYISGQGLRQIDRRVEIHTPGDTWPTATHRPPGSMTIH
jgi:hypothetical protein